MADFETQSCNLETLDEMRCQVREEEREIRSFRFPEVAVGDPEAAL